MVKKRKIIVFCVLTGLVVLIGVLHAVTPGYMIFYHDTYRRLSYFPIAIGAVFFGLKGGVFFAVTSCLSFIPHLLMFWVRGPEAYYSELSEIVFYLAAGIIIGFISSREHRLREKYKRLSEQLQSSYKRLHEQASQLVKAEKQLGQSRELSMLGQVSANLAHEIKNPLASIKGAAEILSEEVDQEHPKFEFIEIMRNEISRLNKSVENVLEYGRGRQMQQKVSLEFLDTILNRVVVMMESSIREKDIQVVVKDVPGPEPFRVEGETMTQVLVNILANAIDAVDHDGQIVIRVSQKEDRCVVHVSDNGPGIDDDLKDKVFHSFVTYKEGGTGIGLSISRKMVESMGGTISIGDSSLGGTKVMISLPDNKEFSKNRSIPGA